jgi:flagellar biosynthesis/type III secretory pathway chaperone
VDSSVCREHLARLIAEEAASLTQLEELLAREHETLVANNIEALEQATEKRQVAIGALLRIEDERRSLCHMHGHSPDLAGLEKLLAWCDPRGTLKAQWAECATRAGRCRDLNERNGALVMARMKRVEGLLSVITRRDTVATYGPQGAYQPPRSGGVLAVEA